MKRSNLGIRIPSFNDVRQMDDNSFTDRDGKSIPPPIINIMNDLASAGLEDEGWFLVDVCSNTCQSPDIDV